MTLLLLHGNSVLQILLPRSILESLFDGFTMFPKVHYFAILSVVLDVINRGTSEKL